MNTNRFFITYLDIGLFAVKYGFREVKNSFETDP